MFHTFISVRIKDSEHIPSPKMKWFSTRQQFKKISHIAINIFFWKNAYLTSESQLRLTIMAPNENVNMPSYMSTKR